MKPTRDAFLSILRRDFPRATFNNDSRGVAVSAPARVALALVARVEAVGLSYRDFVPFGNGEYCDVRVFGFRRSPRGGAR